MSVPLFFVITSPIFLAGGSGLWKEIPYVAGVTDNRTGSSGPRHAPEAVLFVFGMMRRTGTNFLRDLVCLHPDCGAVVPLHEDHFLKQAHNLARFVEEVHGSWRPRWGCPEGLEEQLLRRIGSCLTDFLFSMTAEDWISRPWPDLEGIERYVKATPRVLVPKTPSVQNLEWLWMFQDARALVLVRDGRAVVESGNRSFGWNFEEGVRQWAEAAETVLTEIPKSERLLLVRYEDLFHDLRSEMQRVLAFAGLDAESYDFDAAESLPVRGSSTFRGGAAVTHWIPLEKTEAFDPIERAQDWTVGQHERFNWIAGPQLVKLGYERVAAKRYRRLRTIWNWFLDMRWRRARRRP